MAVANILLNELSKYDNIAYNIKFLMMHPGFPRDGEPVTTSNVNSYSHYVIAETGKTSYAYRLVFQSFDKTLSDDDIAPVMQQIEQAIVKKGWEVR